MYANLIPDWANPIEYAKDAFEAAIGMVFVSVKTMATDALGSVTTAWLSPDYTPTLANMMTERGGVFIPTQFIRDAQGVLGSTTAVILMLSILVATGRMVVTMRTMELAVIARSLVLVVASSLAIISALQLLLMWGDAYSPWVMANMAGIGDECGDGGCEEAITDRLVDLLLAGDLGEDDAGDLIIGYIILFALAGIMALATIGMMLVRGAMLLALMVFLPPVAAATGTPAGMQRFGKVIGYAVAFALFKPVAATIIGLGLALVNPNAPLGNNDMVTLTYGCIILLFAVLSLPMLVKFLVPAAANGASAFFSGATVAAAGAATVAGGAMMARSVATGSAGGGGGLIGRFGGGNQGGPSGSTGGQTFTRGGGGNQGGPTPTGGNGGQTGGRGSTSWGGFGGNGGGNGPTGNSGGPTPTGNGPTGGGSDSPKRTRPYKGGGSGGEAGDDWQDSGSGNLAGGYFGRTGGSDKPKRGRRPVVRRPRQIDPLDVENDEENER